MKRRTLLQTTAVAIGGYAMQTCLPVKYLTGALPRHFKSRTPIAEETALRFAVTAVPAEGILDPRHVDVLWDPFYGFDQYAALFLDLLHTTSDDLFDRPFSKIDHAQRERVVQSILDDGGIGADLVNGALVAIQCSFYAGISDADIGCPTIGFHGRSGVAQGEPSFVPTLRGPVVQPAHVAIN